MSGTAFARGRAAGYVCIGAANSRLLAQLILGLE